MSAVEYSAQVKKAANFAIITALILIIAKGIAWWQTGSVSMLASITVSMLDLLALKDKHPMSLSGGQKQRVAIAGAIASHKEIIVYDEPTSGLDGRNMRSVSKQLHALAEKGHIILMITHDLECALATCSRALVIRGGTLADDFQIDNAERLMAAMRE